MMQKKTFKIVVIYVDVLLFLVRFTVACFRYKNVFIIFYSFSLYNITLKMNNTWDRFRTPEDSFSLSLCGYLLTTHSVFVSFALQYRSFQLDFFYLIF